MGSTLRMVPPDAMHGATVADMTRVTHGLSGAMRCATVADMTQIDVSGNLFASAFMGQDSEVAVGPEEVVVLRSRVMELAAQLEELRDEKDEREEQNQKLKDELVAMDAEMVMRRYEVQRAEKETDGLLSRLLLTDSGRAALRELLESSGDEGMDDNPPGADDGDGGDGDNEEPPDSE